MGHVSIAQALAPPLFQGRPSIFIGASFFDQPYIQCGQHILLLQSDWAYRIVQTTSRWDRGAHERKRPSRQPASQATYQPTNQTANQPTNQPNKQPTNQPSSRPTNQPT